MYEREVFARAGEAVTDEKGKIICRVKNDLTRYSPLSAEDFNEFAEGEERWHPHTQVDRRCVREKPNGGLQICIEGEWRP